MRFAAGAGPQLPMAAASLGQPRRVIRLGQLGLRQISLIVDLASLHLPLMQFLEKHEADPHADAACG